MSAGKAGVPALARRSGPSTDVIAMMQGRGAAFSPAEGRIAETVLRDVDAALSDSIVALAARAEVSPPTMTRFCRRLGCDGFGDFKVRLAQSRFVGTRYLTPEAGPTTPQGIAEHIVNCAQRTLHDTHQALDMEAIGRAADLIAGASLVLAFGSGGGSTMVAAEIENRLFRLGLPVAATGDHQLQLMRASGAPAGSVVVASSFSGLNLPLAAALEAAGDCGLPRIVLTRPGSPVAAQADEVIAIDLAEGPDVLRPTASRYAYLLVIDILAQTVATRLGRPALESMRRIKHCLVLARDADGSQALGD